MSDDKKKTEEEGDMKKFTIAWSIKTTAFDANHAATKAHDILRSRQPIQLSVFKGGSTKNPVRIIPDLEGHLSAAIRRFLPTAQVEIDNEDESDIKVTVIGEHFRDISDEEARSSMVTSCLSALPEKVLENISFYCWTPEEYDQWGDGSWDSSVDETPWGAEFGSGKDDSNQVGKPSLSDFDDTEPSPKNRAGVNPLYAGKPDV